MSEKRRLKKRKKKSIGAVLLRVLANIILVTVIFLCVPITVPRLFGYQIYTVISGSMEPDIPLGSLVYVHERDPETVVEGDVIAYYGNKDGAIITHRVVYNQTVVQNFVTKGDANEREDTIPVSYDRLLGVVVKTIPKLGAVMTAFTETKGKLLAAGLLIVAVFLHIFAGALAEKKNRSNCQGGLRAALFYDFRGITTGRAPLYMI